MKLTELATNLNMEWDSQAYERNEPGFACNNNIQARSSFLRTNEENKR